MPLVELGFRTCHNSTVNSDVPGAKFKQKPPMEIKLQDIPEKELINSSSEFRKC